MAGDHEIQGADHFAFEFEICANFSVFFGSFRIKAHYLNTREKERQGDPVAFFRRAFFDTMDELGVSYGRDADVIRIGLLELSEDLLRFMGHKPSSYLTMFLSLIRKILLKNDKKLLKSVS